MSLEQTLLQERPAPSVSKEGLPKASVFIVDDEAMVGDVVSIVLSLEGFRTRVFTSPSDALEALGSAAEKPELLITDFAMSPVNGIELIKRCRELSPSLRTILYSGNVNNPAEMGVGNEVVADAFLSKPFLPKHLIQTVESVLAR